ncbi:MAG: S8 family serine peptidase [Bacteroidaceae bacterium]|nr:S8 family serine peptidase [Bacteroidaceae bacterium]
MSKKYILIILFLFSCSVGAIAQTTYYYYKGNKIPLTIDDNKVCLSIPKNKRDESKELLKDVQVLDTIRDTVFDISIIQQSDLKRLSATKLWKKEAKVVLLSSCYRTTNGDEMTLTPYLNVRLKNKQDSTLLSLYAERYGLRIVKKDSFLPLWYILSVSPETGKSALDIANIFWESGIFAASVPDLSSDNMISSYDPMFNQQWGLHNSDYVGIDISISDAWNYATGKNVKIAIIDTGVDLNHIDLSANISNLSYDTESDSSPSVYYRNHATHCAGIAAAVKDNGVHIAGVAPEATIISISNCLISSTNSELKLADGIRWAYEHGADVISNSWHTSEFHSAIDEAIFEAFRYGRNGKGCIIVFASGNKKANTVNYPANCNDTILAVGSIDNTGTRANSSNYGTALDMVAPGVSILSTLPNDSVGFKSGTSMACPHVAGVAALILQRNPELTVTQVNSIICRNTKKLSNVNFNETKPEGSWNEQYGYGLVDAYSSLLDTPEIVYIQNDTLTGTQTIPATSSIPAERIYVGRDVTDREDHGRVILGQGDITLRAKSVIIKNSTTVSLGTKLKIVNQ